LLSIQAVQREAEHAEECHAEDQRAVAVRALLGGAPDVDLHVPADQLGDERRVRRHVVRRRRRREHGAVVSCEREPIAVDHHVLHLAAIEIAEQIGERHLRDDDGRAVAGGEGRKQRKDENGGRDPEGARARPHPSKHRTLRS
jgi:hypothetical protein